jgi:hypothetical protein
MNVEELFWDAAAEGRGDKSELQHAVGQTRSAVMFGSEQLGDTVGAPAQSDTQS